MTGLSSQTVQPNGRRYRGRWVLIGFAVCAVVFLVVPNVVVWIGTRDLCPAQVTSRGTTDGTRWEVLRNDCGGDIGFVWQLRVIPDKGYSAVVMQSRGGPEPVGWSQSGFEGQVHLSSQPIGLASATIPIKLDPKGQPLGSVEFENGRLKP
jgi:hypothetical protein